MNTPNPVPPTVSTLPVLPLPAMLKALCHPARWQILKELSAGEPLLVPELAQRLGCSRDMASKHLGLLRRAGMVTSRGRLHQIPKLHLPAPGQPVADFGHCLLRLNHGG